LRADFWVYAGGEKEILRNLGKKPEMQIERG
jgi:hypothetical protein